MTSAHAPADYSGGVEEEADASAGARLCVRGTAMLLQNKQLWTAAAARFIQPRT